MKRTITFLRTCVFTTVSLSMSHSQTSAQTTQVDLRSQTKGVDFSKAASTKPFKMGVVFPWSCAVGDTFFKSDAPAGQNIYSCTAPGVWTLESGGGLPPFLGNADRLLGTNGSQASWVSLGGDVSGPPQTVQVTGLRGNRVASTTPTDGQVLRWNSSALDWEPSTLSALGSGIVNSGASGAGGDLFGNLSSATVTRIQNESVSPVTPADGQVLTWSDSAGQWQPQTLTGAGTTTPASTSATLSVLGVNYSSPNTLTIGGGCSPAAPCNVRFGNNVIAVTTSSTVTWQSGAGTAFFYVTSAGTVTVGSNLTLTCSTGCTTAAGVTAFPVNTIPLYTWSAALNGWDAAGGHDARAYLSSRLISAGTGVFMVESGQQSTIGVDTTLIPTYTNGVASLAFGTLSPASCSADLPVSVPGATLGDSVAPGWPAALPSAVLGTMRVTAANTVAVRLCNLGTASAFIPAGTFRATVVRGL